jgi:N-acetylneuraminic acid mutarotase
LGGARNDLYKYDVFAETWTAMSAKPGGGLIGAVCMPFGDKIIISGGKFQSGKPSAEVWEYSLSSDSWQQKNNYPFAGRWRASATVLNGLGYLLFGSDSSGSYRKELYRYEPVNDNWTQLGDFPTGTGRMYAALGVANSKLFLFGGYDSLGVFYKDLWYYTEATDNWLQGPNLPSTGRRGGMSCTTGDKFYYSCGLGEGPMRLRETWMTDIPLGISGENRSTEIKIYPNPANDKIHIWLSENNNKTLSYRHCTIYGHYSELKELNDFEIDLSSWKAGIYFIEFYSGKRKLGTGRVIKR